MSSRADARKRTGFNRRPPLTLRKLRQQNKTPPLREGGTGTVDWPRAPRHFQPEQEQPLGGIPDCSADAQSVLHALIQEEKAHQIQDLKAIGQDSYQLAFNSVAG